MEYWAATQRWGWQASWRQRRSLSGVFLLGGFLLFLVKLTSCLASDFTGQLPLLPEELFSFLRAGRKRDVHPRAIFRNPGPRSEQPSWDLSLSVLLWSLPLRCSLQPLPSRPFFAHGKLGILLGLGLLLGNYGPCKCLVSKSGTSWMKLAWVFK